MILATSVDPGALNLVGGAKEEGESTPWTHPTGTVSTGTRIGTPENPEMAFSTHLFLDHFHIDGLTHHLE